MHILMLTSVWPTAEHPERAPFVVRQVRFLRRQGVEVTVVPVAGHKDPRRYVQARKEVRSRLKAGGFDLIHTQWAQAALAALPARLPLVVTFRGSDVEGIVNSRQRYTASGWGLRQVSRLVGHMADEAILVASRLARRLPRREYHVIPSGLDLDLFRPMDRAEARSRLGLDPQRRLILFAASPDNPVKRYALARAAVELAQARFPAELLVTACAAPEAMPLYMSACDALLLTSAHEGSPNVVKEALACNLPVISTDVGDVAERTAGVSGCWICPPDPHRLAAAIEQVLERGQRIAGRGAVVDLDETRLTAKLIAVYRKALRRTRQRNPVQEAYEDFVDHSLPQ